MMMSPSDWMTDIFPWNLIVMSVMSLCSHHCVRTSQQPRHPHAGGSAPFYTEFDCNLTAIWPHLASIDGTVLQ